MILKCEWKAHMRQILTKNVENQNRQFFQGQTGTGKKKIALQSNQSFSSFLCLIEIYSEGSS